MSAKSTMPYSSMRARAIRLWRNEMEVVEGFFVEEDEEVVGLRGRVRCLVTYVI